MASSTHRVRRFRKRLGRLARTGNQRRALLVEASACLLLARLALVLIPFRRIAVRLGRVVAPAEAKAIMAATPASAADVHLATEIGWAVTRAARHVPFRAVCLPQAMAARTMLARRGVASVMHYGASKNAADAHAWLEAAGVEVTGYPIAERFTELACFI